MSAKRSDFEYDVSLRKYDNSWQVTAKISSVRAGITDKNDIKDGSCVDTPHWFTVFVGKNQQECKNWVDTNWDSLVKLGIPYEVSN